MIKKNLLTAGIILMLDAIYLNLTKNMFQKLIVKIQQKGDPFKLNLTAAILCYILLTLGISHFVISKIFLTKKRFF